MALSSTHGLIPMSLGCCCYGEEASQKIDPESDNEFISAVASIISFLKSVMFLLYPIVGGTSNKIFSLVINIYNQNAPVITIV